MDNNFHVHDLIHAFSSVDNGELVIESGGLLSIILIELSIFWVTTVLFCYCYCFNSGKFVCLHAYKSLKYFVYLTLQ